MVTISSEVPGFTVCFSISVVQGLHTLFECKESFYFVAVLVPICGKGTSLQLFLASFISS